MTNAFRGKYFFLSNYFSRQIEVNGRKFKSTEHYYQAMKFESSVLQQQVMNAETPNQSKKEARRLSKYIRYDWDEIKLDVMKIALYAKFTQHEDLKQMLIDTGDMILEEVNEWGDRFWGVDDDGFGENHLGKLLMQIRSSFFYVRSFTE